MQFDDYIDRRNTHSMKWDEMEARYGVPAEGGIAMWVADTDFRPPVGVQQALEQMLEHGIYGYFGDDRAYRESIRWWMSDRHLWEIEPDWIFTTHGLVNATGLCVDCWTKPGDGVVLFTPVYHAFARVIEAAGRRVVECPLAVVDGRHVMDFDAYDSQMTGDERMVILCSPHNPGGRVWTEEELQGVAEFAARRDLILVSDEIHHDLVYPGHRHIALPRAAPDHMDRLVMLTAASKTFNLAGAQTGNVIIPDEKLRAAFARKLAGLGISPNAFGMQMVSAAYTSEGGQWVDALVEYLDANRQIFDEGMAEIPGLRSMPLESTYLAWVDFSALEMSESAIIDRVQNRARIAANRGPSFGKGGAGHLRFNFGTPRSLVVEAVTRLQQAFADKS